MLHWVLQVLLSTTAMHVKQSSHHLSVSATLHNSTQRKETQHWLTKLRHNNKSLYTHNPTVCVCMKKSNDCTVSSHRESCSYLEGPALLHLLLEGLTLTSNRPLRFSQLWIAETRPLQTETQTREARLATHWRARRVTGRFSDTSTVQRFWLLCICAFKALKTSCFTFSCFLCG